MVYPHLKISFSNSFFHVRATKSPIGTSHFLVVLAIFLLFSNLASAQFKPFPFKPSHKKWEDGKLTWNDFLAKPMAVSPLGSELIYYFFYKPEKVKTRDTTFYKLRVYAFIDRNQCWAHDTAKTETNLKGNQVIFNIIELHRRKVENRLVLTDNNNVAANAFQEQYRLLRETIARFVVETKAGKDSARLNAWFARSYRQVDSVKVRLPGFAPGKFGYGMHAGYGKANVTGKLANNFTGFSGIAFGFDLGYKELLFFLTGDVGSGKTIRDYQGNYHWPADLDVNLLQLSGALGYPVLNAAHWRIVPFAGPALVGITPNVAAGDAYKDQSIQQSTVAFGLQLDWKYKNQVNFMPVGGRSLSDYGLRMRFIYYPVEFAQNLNGSTYNISLSAYFHTRQFKLK
jgi:hypothetical protein